jgi:hypothetical protein
MSGSLIMMPHFWETNKCAAHFRLRGAIRYRLHRDCDVLSCLKIIINIDVDRLSVDVEAGGL